MDLENSTIRISYQELNFQNWTCTGVTLHFSNLGSFIGQLRIMNELTA